MVTLVSPSPAGKVNICSNSSSSPSSIYSYRSPPPPPTASNFSFNLGSSFIPCPCKRVLHHRRSSSKCQSIVVGNGGQTSSFRDDDDHNKSSKIIQGEEKEKEEAIEAVSEILQKFGVSNEESIRIASSSPNYLQMLIDSVRDLDDHSLWDTWTTSTTTTSSSGIGGDSAASTTPSSPSLSSSFNFKMKVSHMARQKGDKGMLPFLESSVGLSLSSAMHVARRYLSSQTLTKLIQKVKYMKGIIFCGSAEADEDGLLIKGNARRMIMHLSIPVDEDLQQTLSFFEKIQARRGGLDLIFAPGDASFRYLIESFPRLLLLPLEQHITPLVDFLEDIGIPKGCMKTILLLFPPIIFYDIEKDIKPRIQAFEKINAGNKDLSRMLLKYPWILSTSIQENYEEILSFFDTEKVPKVYVDRAIKSWPHLLGCSVCKLKPIVGLFGELGVKNKKLGQVIATSPQLLLKKPQEYLQVIYFLRELGLDEEAVGRILGRCPEIFATSIDKTLKKKVEFLSGIGVPKSHLPRVIRKYPELFVCDINRSLLPRMKYLIKIGLSKREVALMVCRFSPLLGYSIDEVLRPKLDFLMNTMEKPLRDVTDYPRYFSYSLEKKIKPRYWVLKGRNVECSLKDMLGKNDEEFAAEFMGI